MGRSFLSLESVSEIRRYQSTGRVGKEGSRVFVVRGIEKLPSNTTHIHTRGFQSADINERLADTASALGFRVNGDPGFCIRRYKIVSDALIYDGLNQPAIDKFREVSQELGIDVEAETVDVEKLRNVDIARLEGISFDVRKGEGLDPKREFQAAVLGRIANAGSWILQELNIVEALRRNPNGRDILLAAYVNEITLPGLYFMPESLLKFVAAIVFAVDDKEPEKLISSVLGRIHGPTHTVLRVEEISQERILQALEKERQRPSLIEGLIARAMGYER